MTISVPTNAELNVALPVIGLSSKDFSRIETIPCRQKLCKFVGQCYIVGIREFHRNLIYICNYHFCLKNCICFNLHTEKKNPNSQQLSFVANPGSGICTFKQLDAFHKSMVNSFVPQLFSQRILGAMGELTAKY